MTFREYLNEGKTTKFSELQNLFFEVMEDEGVEFYSPTDIIGQITDHEWVDISIKKK